jgi:hypothetical protein
MMALQWNEFRCVAALIVTCLLGVIPKSYSVTWQPPVQLNPTPDGAADGLIGADDNGNAVALLEDSGAILAYHYTNGSWGSPQVLFPGTTSDVVAYDLSTIPSGQAIATWCDFDNPDTTSRVYSAFFDGTSWSTPTPNPVDSSLTNIFQAVTISMNDSTNAILLSQTAFPSNINYYILTSGVWSSPLPLATISGPNFQSTPIAYSNNGKAVAAWYDTGSAMASIFNGSIWTTTNVGSIGGASNPLVGIDSNGHALVVWADPSSDIQFSYWNGSSWSPAANISAAPSNGFFAALSMAPGGTAIAAWADPSGNGIYSTFNGSTWSTPAIFSSILGIFSDFSVSTDSMGNALIVYATTASDIEALTLPLGGSLGPVEIVVPSGVEPGQPGVVAALSSDGVQFAILNISDGEGTNVFGAATLFVPPPNALGLKGSVCKNKFATQAELVKTIKWSPSQNPTVVGYTLTRNGTLIATIPSSGPFTYRDHRRCKRGTDTYTLTAINAAGAAVVSATITL